jgi:hypothetical protein
MLGAREGVFIRFIFLYCRQLILFCYQFKMKILRCLHDTFYCIINIFHISKPPGDRCYSPAVLKQLLLDGDQHGPKHVVFITQHFLFVIILYLNI